LFGGVFQTIRTPMGVGKIGEKKNSSGGVGFYRRRRGTGRWWYGYPEWSVKDERFVNRKTHSGSNTTHFNNFRGKDPGGVTR